MGDPKVRWHISRNNCTIFLLTRLALGGVMMLFELAPASSGRHWQLPSACECSLF